MYIRCAIISLMSVEGLRHRDQKPSKTLQGIAGKRNGKLEGIHLLDDIYLMFELKLSIKSPQQLRLHIY